MNKDRITVEDADEAVTFTLKQLESEGYTFDRYDNGSVVYVIHERDGTELGKLAVFSTWGRPGVLIGGYCPAADGQELRSEFKRLSERIMEGIEERAMKDVVCPYGARPLSEWSERMELSELELQVLTSSRGRQGKRESAPVMKEERQFPTTQPDVFKNQLLGHIRKLTEAYTRQFPIDVTDGYFHQLPANSERHFQLSQPVYSPPVEEQPLFETESGRAPGSHLVTVPGQYCIVTKWTSGYRSDCYGVGVMMQFEIVPGILDTIQVTAECLYPEVVDCFVELLDAIDKDYETAKRAMIKVPGPVQEAAPFHDFELLIADRQQEGYPVRVIASSAGQAEGFFKMPWEQHDLEQALIRMEEGDTDEAFLVGFGTELFNALFTDDIRRRYDESVGGTAVDAGLRIQLRLDPQDLRELPWEMLYDPEKREFLALSKRALITRYLDVPRSTPPLPVTPPLRLLVVTATPKDWNPLSVEQEVQGIVEALQPLVKEGLVKLLVEEHITKYLLEKRLSDDAPHMLHYVGHGDFDGEHGILILEDDRQLSDTLDGQRLATLLKDTPVRLAVLNCCLSAKDTAADARQFGSRRAALLGVGPALVDAGLGAVVAMQFSADDRAAVVFAQGFYEMMAHRKPIDEAIERAREMAVLHSGMGNRDWATPVLFMRAPDGRLFETTNDLPVCSSTVRV